MARKPEPLTGHIQDAFDVAERFAVQMMAELHRRIPRPEHAEEAFEQAVGALVLMCITKPGNNGPVNINHVIADEPWQLVATH